MPLKATSKNILIGTLFSGFYLFVVNHSQQLLASLNKIIVSLIDNPGESKGFSEFVANNESKVLEFKKQILQEIAKTSKEVIQISELPEAFVKFYQKNQNFNLQEVL